MKICRGCLSTELQVKFLNESIINNFNLITNLNIGSTEETPVLLCDKCFNSLNNCIEFRDQCIASDVKLKEMLSPLQSEKSNVVDFHVELTIEDIKEDPDDVFDDYTNKNKPLDGDLNDNDTYHELAQKDDQQKEKPRRSTRKSKRKSKTTKKIHKPKEIKIGDSEIFNCGLCTKIYERKKYLIKHLEKVHKTSKVCSLCQLSCVGYPHLLAHRMEHIPKEQRGCLFCINRHIITQTTMEFHYMKIHDLGEENEKFLCKICLKSYESPEKLNKHMNAVHVEFKIICDHCSKRFRTKKEVTIHLACHSEEKRYVCDRCDYKSKYRRCLKLHKTRRHVKDKSVCKPCGRVFQTKDLMEEHKTKCKHNVNVGNVVCPICGITVKRLNRHISTHSKVNKFKCEKCPSTFKTKPAYIVHMNKHDGIKKQKCQYCSRRFYSRPTLLKHLRIHTGEKPYVCKICSKGFTSNHNLKVHMKVHGITNLIVKRNKDPEEAIEIITKL